MEHEDNTQLENYLQNPQNNIIMENLQMASGVAGEIGDGGEEIVALGGIGIGASHGGKFEEHDERDDDDEWKYIKEVQQSEKQQTRNDVAAVDDHGHGDADGDGVGRVGVGVVGIGIGNGNGSANHEHNEPMGIGNGDVAAARLDGDDGFAAAARIAGAFEPDAEEEEVEIIKNDADFSTTSNTASTAGDDDDVEAVDVLQVEMKIEVEHEQQQLENMGRQREDDDEEEPSSLATNTTNGTSSLSENAPQQQLQHDETFGDAPSVSAATEPKDGVDHTLGGLIDGATQPDAFEFESHSQLNPDAKEFVPSFGSNPASPTVLAAGAAPFGDAVASVGGPAVEPDAELQAQAAHTGVLPRHMLADDDDILAFSPRKGRGANMDGIAVPPELEFEHECAKRPHEVEQEDDMIGDGPAQPIPLEDKRYENGHDLIAAGLTDGAGLLDHGPETCVDLDGDIDEQFMRSPGEGLDADVFNTVQQLPDYDSVNSSFVDEPQPSRDIMMEEDVVDDVVENVKIGIEADIFDVAGDKELLNVEEKEHVSHSPSTEEMQMNFQNELHDSTKDIPQIPIDMDNAAHMHESFYMENTSSDAPAPLPLLSAVADQSLLIDTSMPLEPSQSDISLPHEEEDEEGTLSPMPSPAVTPTPAESAAPQADQWGLEKHLIEETKEQFSTEIDELEQKMSALNVVHDASTDGNLSQIEDVAQIATTIGHNENPFFGQDDDEPMEVVQSPVQVAPMQQQEHPEFDRPPMAWSEAREDKDSVNLFDQLHQLEVEVPQQPPPVSQFEDEFVRQEALETAAFTATSTAPVMEERGFFEEKLPEVSAPSVAPPVEEPVAAPSEPIAEIPLPDAAEMAMEAVEEPAATKTSIEAVAATAIAATVGIGAAIAASTAAKKPSTAAGAKVGPSSAGKTAVAGKPKVGADAKKPLAAKTASLTAARPRTAPAKTSPGSSAERKTIASTTGAARPAVGAARKPLAAAGTATARPALKTTAASTASRTTASTLAKTSTTTRTTATPRSTLTTSAPARKPIGTTAASHAASNGAAAKPRPASASTASAPTKPTTLGLSAAGKPKATSPRSTLTSQLRKSAPTAGTTAAASGAKSPTKSVSATNGTTATRTSAAAIMRPKPAAGGSSTTTITKTFTARPAPRTSLTITSTTSTTTRRMNLAPTGGSTTSRATTISSLKKTHSPVSKSPTSAGKISPPKGAGGAGLKNITKEAVSKTKAVTAGDAPAAGHEPHMNGGGAHVHEAGQQNGDGVSLLLEQHHQPPPAAELVVFDE